MTLLLSNRCEIFSLGLAGRNIQVKHISNLHMIRSVMNSLVASGQAANVHLNTVVILQKLGLRLIYFFRLRISQCSSFCLFGNSTDKNAFLQIGCLSVTWHRKSLCSWPYFWTLYSLLTGPFLLYSFLSSWKLLYKTGENKSSVAFFFQSWCENIEWHPPWIS